LRCCSSVSSFGWWVSAWSRGGCGGASFVVRSARARGAGPVRSRCRAGPGPPFVASVCVARRRRALVAAAGPGSPGSWSAAAARSGRPVAARSAGPCRAAGAGRSASGGGSRPGAGRGWVLPRRGWFIPTVGPFRAAPPQSDPKIRRNHHPPQPIRAEPCGAESFHPRGVRKGVICRAGPGPTRSARAGGTIRLIRCRAPISGSRA
jgi:hypothetical protein